jgi:hypothetical protein
MLQNSIIKRQVWKVGLVCQFIQSQKKNKMKTRLTTICIFFFLLNCFYSAKAQKSKKFLSKIYLKGGGGVNSHSGNYGEASLQGVVHNKWSFSISYHDMDMKPKNIPSDYVPGWGYVLFIPYSDEARIKMQLVTVSAGKYFSAGRNLWFTTEAGISFVNGEKISFQHADNSNAGGNFILGGYYPSNYTTTTEKKTAVGGMLKADINWAFCRFMGLDAGVFANLNSIQSPIGFNIKLSAGAMGWLKKLKQKKMADIKT